MSYAETPIFIYFFFIYILNYIKHNTGKSCGPETKTTNPQLHRSCLFQSKTQQGKLKQLQRQHVTISIQRIERDYSDGNKLMSTHPIMSIGIGVIGSCRWGCWWSYRGRVPAISTVSSVTSHSSSCHGGYGDNSLGQALKNLSFDQTSPWRNSCVPFLLGRRRIGCHHY